MNFESATELIELANHIVITGHKNADLDCIGSSFALSLALSGLGKKSSVLVSGSIATDMEYLFHYFDQSIDSVFPEGTDLVIIVDSSDLSRLDSSVQVESFIQNGGKTILIDHHTRGNLGNLVNCQIVSEQACSTSEIIYKLLIFLGIVPDKNIATCLLAGIIGDTSSFQNQNTTGSCLDIASSLMKSGGRLRTIITNSFENREVDALKLWGLAMERLNFNKKYDVASTYITQEDIKKYGLSSDAVSGIVNYLNSIKGAKLVIFIMEDEPGQIKISFRTRDPHVDVAKLARQFGGGGHVKASGATFAGSIVAAGTGAQLN